MKHKLSYILCIFVAVIFAWSMNGRLGVYLCAMLLFALIVSAVIKRLVKNRISLKVFSKTTQVAKGDTIEISFEISKSTFVPTPFIEVCFSSSGNISPLSPERFRIALGFSKEPRTYRISYRANHCGMASIEVGSVTLIDYLGLFASKVKTESFKSRFGVLPVIHEISGQNELLRVCCDATAYDDNAEETDEATTIGMGVAGYEHREYVVGDPIKRINWKLSSKRDTLMIRLDEKLASASQAIVFDCSSEKEESEQYYKTRDIAAEGALAMSALMLRQGLTCDVYMSSNNQWEHIVIEDEGGLAQFQSSIADFIASSENAQSAADLIAENGNKVAMMFSNNSSYAVQTKVLAKEAGCDLYTVLPHTVTQISSADYSISDDFEFTNT
ncbi:MAG: DUF58 domain-containing protein [Oscillospiraceae bacterium]|nr:DUF58 domain-containing protein [Oscillospiraceae bacterium]